MTPPPFIELVDVSKVYPGLPGKGERRVLDRINLRLFCGQSTGIIGVSGAGKSTLARLVLGLEPPTSGDLYFHGRKRCRRRRSDRNWLRHKIQIIWQDPVIYLNPYRTAGQTVAEALAVRGVAAHERKGRIEELFRMVRLSLTILPRRPHEMSGGQAQRLSIARALAFEPELLVCDEILSGLDLPNQINLIDLLGRLQAKSRMALLFISHDLAPILRLCRHLVVLSGGRIVSQGAPRDILACPGHETTHRLVEHYLRSDPSLWPKEKRGLPEMKTGLVGPVLKDIL